MDDRSFDALTRALGGASTRRGALAALAGAVTGFGMAGHDARAKRKRRKCDPACAAGQTCRQGTCACDDGGAACGASCCRIGQVCDAGQCVAEPEPATCVAFGEPCKNVGVPCCEGLQCGSGQGGDAVACWVRKTGRCASTAECVYGTECKEGICVGLPQPTPTPDDNGGGESFASCTPNVPDGDTTTLLAKIAAGEALLPANSSFAFPTVSGQAIAITAAAKITACGGPATITCDGAGQGWKCIYVTGGSLDMNGVRLVSTTGANSLGVAGIQITSGLPVTLKNSGSTGFSIGVYNAFGNLTCGAGNRFCGNGSLNCQQPPNGVDIWQSCSGCVQGDGACPV